MDYQPRLSEIYGSQVFSEAVMQERLPKNVFQALKNAMRKGEGLNPALADVVANAMKDWAIELGATHFCHWFQPMTGSTAEKHDSFISPRDDGRTIMEFSGKELRQGEPDASSFPSGGLRATFEARGYTAWDCTSPVFVKRNGENCSLYIPSAFCSYTGEALDKKTPLLRSMEALNRAALRVLRALGNHHVNRVYSTLGAEQEYFLVDARFLEKRLDLLLTGRTLVGALPPKGQEMADHYFGAVDERVASFMNEVNFELWKLGISAKTQHNEVAPGQYEIAPIYATVNVAVDQNQLTMETLRRVAKRHGFVCLLHEKPFAGVNGSGKHNNWSLVTDEGVNLLDPGATPHQNRVFLVFLCAIVAAVDRYAELLRASVATAGNDHRLGAHEAPPAILSIFLGDQLTDIFEQLAGGGARTSKTSTDLRLGVSALPPLPKDVTDRNRTSPFAFTGNKFEFRMVGASLSCAGPNFVLNTAVAQVLSEIASRLEQAQNVDQAAQEICRELAQRHRRIIFNGDNYDPAWIEEARRRGLPNLLTTVDALRAAHDEAYFRLFEHQGVLSRKEYQARLDILMEMYVKTVRIEAKTLLDIGRRQILPAVTTYAARLAHEIQTLASANLSSEIGRKDAQEVTSLVESLRQRLDLLEMKLQQIQKEGDMEKAGHRIVEELLPAMREVRETSDALEQIVDANLWPLPTYAQMLFMR